MKYSLVLFIWISGFSLAQTAAYQLYDKNGKKVNFEKMAKKLAEKDVILFGELHNDPIAHWMQYKLTQHLHELGSLSLGAEMIEADDQLYLDDYLAGVLDQKGFDTLARLWFNHKTDYKPLVDFSKENKLPFIATNVPRRYASKVYKNGFEVLSDLSDAEKEWIAPLPIPYDAELPGYKAMQTMMSDHANENFPKAQAIKDATMAHFIVQHLTDNPRTFLHFNGAYHSNNYEGVFWYIKQYNPLLTIGTISTVLQSDVQQLKPEHKGIADYVLVVDEDMTTTY